MRPAKTFNLPNQEIEVTEHKREIDTPTGFELMHHKWDDDLQELNRPLPRWWLYSWYFCILLAVAYWIAFPAWPMISGYTPGLLGYSTRQSVETEIKAARAAQGQYMAALATAPIETIKSDPKLMDFANAAGKAAFGDNCSACHGRGAQGAKGYPNLNDDIWIWGGTLQDIHLTIQYGIRNGNDKARNSAMPRFGLDGMLQPEQIGDAAEFVRQLSGQSHDATAAGRGKAVFADNCAVCHGEQGKGNQEMGSINLTANVWLYGGTKADIVKTIQTGRGGVMPVWSERLDAATVKALAVYVHSLGGGK
jgi:cytochrome c oxidase cbb3-type subunit 3